MICNPPIHTTPPPKKNGARSEIVSVLVVYTRSFPTASRDRVGVRSTQCELNSKRRSRTSAHPCCRAKMSNPKTEEQCGYRPVISVWDHAVYGAMYFVHGSRRVAGRDLEAAQTVHCEARHAGHKVGGPELCGQREVGGSGGEYRLRLSSRNV